MNYLNAKEMRELTLKNIEDRAAELTSGLEEKLRMACEVSAEDGDFFTIWYGVTSNYLLRSLIEEELVRVSDKLAEDGFGVSIYKKYNGSGTETYIFLVSWVTNDDKLNDYYDAIDNVPAIKKAKKIYVA